MTRPGGQDRGTRVQPGAESASPLAGITVIEIGHSVAAPFAGQVLADLGATVVKVENPSGGDDARHWGPPFWNGASATFQTLNRNKYSAAIDMKDEAGRQALLDLAAKADVLIQNMRPGLVERYRIDATTLRALNPGLIYCNVGAFGVAGPLKDQTGYDPLIQAFCGIMSVTGEVDRPPVRVGPSIIDMGAGLWSVVGILAALLKRRETEEGTTIDTSLYETGIAWMNIPLANSMASGMVGTRSGSETPMLAPYRAFRASDTHVVIAAGNDNLFRRLCEVVGAPDWADDPRFLTNPDRVANRETLNALLEALIGQRPAAEWRERLAAVGVPCAPLQTTTEVAAHPQTQALGILRPTPDGSMTLVGTPLSFDGVRPDVRAAAPLLGADTDHALDLFNEARAEVDPAERSRHRAESAVKRP
jgi:crotonobetainyl-CoA:carnitine CoA-transferase CaiB-like acyl-CoA transferase